MSKERYKILQRQLAKTQQEIERGQREFERASREIERIKKVMKRYEARYSRWGEVSIPEQETRKNRTQ